MNRCEEISAEGLINFSESLKKLNNLTNITLIFSECQKISDEAMLNLGDAVKGLSSLQSIELNFFE